MTKVLVVATILAAVAAHPIRAQVANLAPGDGVVVGVEASKAFISDSELSWYTSVLRGRLLAPIGSRAHFMLDYGVSILGTDAGTDATFANPETGVVFTNTEGAALGFLTVVLPLSKTVGDDDGSAGLGLLTDFIWPERFLPDVFSVNAGWTPSADIGERTSFDLLVVGSVMVPTGDGGDTELFARYGADVVHTTETLRFHGGVRGLAIMSESDLSFSDRTLHQLEIGVGRAGPGLGLFLRLPIEDGLEEIDAIVGVTITF
jgi:hypothetical protein